MRLDRILNFLTLLAKAPFQLVEPADGDILIDNSVRHRKRWVKAGRIWVTHPSAEGTVATLDIMGV